MNKTVTIEEIDHNNSVLSNNIDWIYPNATHVLRYSNVNPVWVIDLESHLS